MFPRLLTLLCLALAGCSHASVEVQSRFIDASPASDCRVLWDAVQARGWRSELARGDDQLDVLAVDETWVLSGRVEWYRARGWLPVRWEQPQRWSAWLTCPPSIEREELEVRTCRFAGHSFGVVDPRRSKTIRHGLPAPHSCRLDVRAELRRGHQASGSSTVTLQRSLRPYLEGPR